MDSATIEVTLTRAHKFAERIRALMGDAQQRATMLSTGVHVDGYAGEPHLAELRSLAQRAVEALDEFLALASLYEATRAAIGRANAASGVSDLLATHDAVSRKLMLLKSITELPSNSRISLDALPTFRPLFPESRSSILSSGMYVSLVTPELLARVEQYIDELQATAYRTSDRLAEANAFKVALEVPKRYAHALGLA
jgi:hypothetical protein